MGLPIEPENRDCIGSIMGFAVKSEPSWPFGDDCTVWSGGGRSPSGLDCTQLHPYARSWLSRATIRGAAACGRFNPSNVFRPLASRLDAIAAAGHAMQCGFPIVICSHSISYMSRFLGYVPEGRRALAELLHGLLKAFPNLRLSQWCRYRLGMEDE